MPKLNPESNIGTVKWVDIEANIAIDIANEVIYGNADYGDNWSWAFEFYDGEQVQPLFGDFRQIGSMSDLHNHAVRQIAAMVMVSCPTAFRDQSFETAMSRALGYLAAPTPWFGQEGRLESILAYSSHALLDIEGFLEMRRAFALRVKQMPELQCKSA